MRRNSTVDVLRIAACLAAVLVHIPVGGEIGQVIQAIGRYCVIYFLLVGGYYLYRPSSTEMIPAVKRYMRSMLIIAACCLAYFFAADTIVCLLQVQPPLLWLSAPKSLWDFLVFNRSECLDAVMFYPLSVVYSCVVYY